MADSRPALFDKLVARGPNRPPAAVVGRPPARAHRWAEEQP